MPFIGSGMSLRTCTDWPTFIKKLETATGQSELSPRKTIRAGLLRPMSSSAEPTARCAR